MSDAPLVLAFGDSLIAGYGLPEPDRFPAVLERALRVRTPAARVIPAGVSGETTGDALARLPRTLSALDRQPDLAVVQIGPNDVLRQLPPARMRANLDAILAEFARCGIRVLLALVEPPPFLRAHATFYLGIHEALAAQHGAATCAFFPAGVLGHPDMVLADRVHPNARAIAKVVAAMLPVVEGLLE